MFNGYDIYSSALTKPVISRPAPGDCLELEPPYTITMFLVISEIHQKHLVGILQIIPNRQVRD
jgi:hypothetical protein